MARRSPLHVWMNGSHVGVWTPPTHGADSFEYDPDWVTSPTARILSLSLPFTPGNVPHKGDTVSNYFDNLLPDAETIRQRIRARFSTPSSRAFDLLTAVGRDCVGAVQLLPAGLSPIRFDRIEGVPLNEAEVERALKTVTTDRPLGQAGQFRISLAGAQEKMALLFHEGKWCEPQGATPTTHIFKLPLGQVGEMRADLLESVENEWLCLRILAAFELPVARSSMSRFGDTKALVVERFDRVRHKDGWLVRLPQEDFCQVMGLPGSLKYESDGGPGMKAILSVLNASSRSGDDKLTVVKAQLLFWMLAAVDGHAKNFSIFHEPGGRFRLTPLYDVLSAWPIIGKGKNQLAIQDARLAMSVRSKNVHWKLREIKPRHWSNVTQLAGMGDADALVAELAAKTDSVIESVEKQLPRRFPARISETIFKGLRDSARILRAG
jgi:serine/threonine-protein kinase HipA